MMLDEIARKAASTIMDKAEADKSLHRSDLEDAIGKAIREAIPYLTPAVCVETWTVTPWTFTDQSTGTSGQLLLFADQAKGSQ